MSMNHFLMIKMKDSFNFAKPRLLGVCHELNKIFNNLINSMTRIKIGVARSQTQTMLT